MARTLIVSNRLPVTVRTAADGAIEVVPSSGGLATGLGRVHERGDTLWIGWPGDLPRLSRSRRAGLDEKLAGFGTVHLTAAEVAGYYDGFSNGVLWPLFHYLLDKVRLDASKEWETYRAVNERFADRIVAAYRPGDTIWIHDYQLTLVPALVRRRLPEAAIGFFLHIPFPASEVFRLLPWREAILEGMLGADLIGFHTHAYQHAFSASLRHILGFDTDIDRVRHRGRTVQLGVFPMGIDAARFQELADDEVVRAEVRRHEAVSNGRVMVLSVDRLDYTKGIPRRLAAIERLLETEPDLRSAVRFVQIAVPSRTQVDSYAQFRRRIDEMVGRINGLYGDVDHVPIHYIYGSVSDRELCALYAAARVMLVTPLRDGMNLVAKEYVAARTDGDGVLVLSEFAGAAAELGESLLVNPYDVEGLAVTIKRALGMPESERRLRMQALRERVSSATVHHWSDSFLARLRQAALRPATPPTGTVTPDLIDRLRRAERLILLLDYDGTLVTFTRVPDLAAPDAGLLDLLATAARRAGTSVHVVSGRSRATLERWLGDLPIGLHAEHGLWSRTGPDAEWRANLQPETAWKSQVRPILKQFADRTPGSRIEEKTASIAWHYRMADPDFGERQVRELRIVLTDALSNLPVEILPGDKVLEVRQLGVTKGLVASALAEGETVMILAVGDDRTDEDLFAALPPHAVTIRVGAGTTQARFRLGHPVAVRDMLHQVLATATSEPDRSAPPAVLKLSSRR